MVYYTNNSIDFSTNLFLISCIVIPLVICGVLISTAIALVNKNKQKQFANIKNNGDYFEGVIVMASYHLGGKYDRKLKSSGDLEVNVDNKIYTITDIDYNDEFKLLKQKLKDNFNENGKKYII